MSDGDGARRGDVAGGRNLTARQLRSERIAVPRAGHRLSQPSRSSVVTALSFNWRTMGAADLAQAILDCLLPAREARELDLHGADHGQETSSREDRSVRAISSWAAVNRPERAKISQSGHGELSVPLGAAQPRPHGRDEMDGSVTRRYGWPVDNGYVPEKPRCPLGLSPSRPQAVPDAVPTRGLFGVTPDVLCSQP